MVLWTVTYQNDGPRTDWYTNREEASVAAKQLHGAEVAKRELPTTRAGMADWLNANNVESWQ